MKITGIGLTFLLFFLYGALAFASDTMVITFKDGRSQTVTLTEPSCNIKSITFSGTPSTSSSSHSTPSAGTAPTIRVVSAKYGVNCRANYNVARVATECNGKTECHGIIDNRYAGHDPAPGCGKDFTIDYFCGNTSKRTYVPGVLSEGGRWSLVCP